MQQFSDEYKKITPTSKVPAIVDKDGFKMFESHAIMKYLCNTRGLADHWYPLNDCEQIAKIDMYLDWHHANIRMGAEGYLYRKFISPMIGKPAPQEALD